jgi:hypothetical protein
MTAIENEQELFPGMNGQHHPAGDRGEVKRSAHRPEFMGEGGYRWECWVDIVSAQKWS